MTTDLVIGMAGAGGDGVIAAGEALMTAAARGGYRAMMAKSYGPQIRGGESSFRLRIGTGEILNAGAMLDIAVALNWDDFLRFGAELPVDGRTTVVHDPAQDARQNPLPLEGISPAETVAVPVAEMARASAGTEKAKNTVVLGLLAGWLGLPPDGLMAGLRKRFARKHPEVLAGAERAFDAGLAFAQVHPLRDDRRLSAAAPPPSPRWLADGNEMCAAAALVAGCEFFGGYPITPSSEIMHFLGREIWKYGGIVLQAEDEIAGIGAVIGASFAGRKAMTATSGPGMSLKSEMLGLATIAEVPLVCVNVQRGGPSTGIPTKSEQSDLFQAAFSAHGDAVRPVLAPVSVADTCRITIEAFNIAEQFQTPVILLSDADIAQRKEVVDPIDAGAFPIVDRRAPNERELEHYARFQITESGVSPISHPGIEDGTFLASGIEHNEHGAPTASGDVHARMNEKRIRKIAPLKARRDLFSTEGDRDAPVGLISWGSVAGVASEATAIARREGVQLKLLVPRLLYPVSEEVYEDFFASVRAGLVVEQSHQGQLFRIIRMFVDVPRGLESLARSGSNPITVHDVLDRVRQMVMTFQRQRVPQEEPTLG
ncbi:MAG: 2-oxoacid:acceptor oxidoreductase subunit alpha [Acidobacteria bacterium]|nr:2-oxoacid:acceptor oxidoreductase subunit alpha [Acidobacteriota bacterium]